LITTIEAAHYCGSLDLENKDPIWTEVAYIMSMAKDIRMAEIMWGSSDKKKSDETVIPHGHGKTVIKRTKVV